MDVKGAASGAVPWAVMLWEVMWVFSSGKELQRKDPDVPVYHRMAHLQIMMWKRELWVCGVC